MYIAPDEAAQIAAQHARTLIVLCDFDGTLAPIVSHARDARISGAAREALRALARRIPVAVVTGRAISDIRQLCGVRGLCFAGNHGLETSVRGKVVRHVSRGSVAIMRRVATVLASVAARYAGAYLEDKKLGAALHYRPVADMYERTLRREARAAVAPYLRDGSIRVLDDKKTFDVAPGSVGGKGTAARYIVRKVIGARAYPVYIGDSMTDEDAFCTLAHGLTIRVGYKKGSAARYHFRTRNEVDEFLSTLATILK